MQVYVTRYSKLSGSNFAEVKLAAQAVYNQYVAHTKRQPYIRSKYFKNDKVFLAYFWDHLWQKNWRDRMRRLKYLPAAPDLIKNSTFEPSTKQNVNKSSDRLHRFYGLTRDKDLFYIQIKEEVSSGKKY